MKNEKTTDLLVISNPSQKFKDLLAKIRKHKLAQQEKLSETDKCTFNVSL